MLSNYENLRVQMQKRVDRAIAAVFAEIDRSISARLVPIVSPPEPSNRLSKEEFQKLEDDARRFVMPRVRF